MGEIVFTSYLSHGAPTSLVEKTAIHAVYEKLGKILSERGVDTVVISSPHYIAEGEFEIESREDIPCIQDYYGFPEEMYGYSYQAKNNLDLVSRIVEEAKLAGLRVRRSESWGLDHGAWLPLYFMFPQREVKVVPVSITAASPQDHFNFGEAIHRAVSKGGKTVAVIGTGSPLHRLDLIRFGYYGSEKFEPGEEFDDKLIETIRTGDFNKILGIGREYPALFHAAAPEGNLNPLFVALGATDHARFIGRTVLHEFMYFGVSLVVTLLGAEEGLLDSLVDRAALHPAKPCESSGERTV